jgi:hypothetical protein
MKLENLLWNYKKTSMYWFWLGVLEVLLDLFIVGVSRWEFPYGIAYGFGMISFALVLAHENKQGDESTFAGAILAMFAGLLIVLLEATTGGFFGAVTVAVLNVILFIGVVTFELGILKFKSLKSKYASLILIGTFLAWFVWPIVYFYQRYQMALSENINTLMYHGGISLLAGFEILAIIMQVADLKFGSGKKKDDYYGIPLLFFFVAVLGMLLTVGVLGWGLQLTA